MGTSRINQNALCHPFYLSSYFHGIESHSSFQGIDGGVWGKLSYIDFLFQNLILCDSFLLFYTLSEYNLLFRQLCLRMNFSSHQKHNPFSLLSSNSWFLIGFMGLMKVLLVLLVRVLVQWAGFDFVMVV